MNGNKENFTRDVKINDGTNTTLNAIFLLTPILGQFMIPQKKLISLIMIWRIYHIVIRKI
jgi:hypothetical protein